MSQDPSKSSPVRLGVTVKIPSPVECSRPPSLSASSEEASDMGKQTNSSSNKTPKNTNSALRSP